MNIYLILLACFLLSVLVGEGTIKLVLYIAYRNKVFDLPNERKVHTIPVPRLGGLAFLPTLMVVITFTLSFMYRFNIITTPFLDSFFVMRLAFLLGSALILYVVGLLDDLVGINFKIKFLGQFIAAMVIALSGLWFHRMYGLFGLYDLNKVFGILITVFVLVFVMNAINLIDGIDGLASGICIVSLICFSIIYIYEKRFFYAMIAVSTLGVLSVFWMFNMFGNPDRKSKLYMGDTGSLTLGLIISFLIMGLGTFYGHNGLTRNCKYFIIAFSSILIPMMDVLRLFLYRIRHKRNPFLPDMNHIHHKLMQLGLSPRQTLWTILAAEVFLIGINALMSRYINVNIILCIDFVLYFTLVLVLTKMIVKKKSNEKLASV